jgi:hypothetical protein
MEPELKYKENPKNHSPKPGSIKNTVCLSSSEANIFHDGFPFFPPTLSH